MASHTEIDRRQTAHTELTSDVDQEGDFHAVRLLQGDDVEGAASPGGLAGEGLSYFAESGVKQRQNRASGQFVDAPAPGRHVVQRPFVISLYQLGFRALEERLDEASHEL